MQNLVAMKYNTLCNINVVLTLQTSGYQTSNDQFYGLLKKWNEQKVEIQSKVCTISHLYQTQIQEGDEISNVCYPLTPDTANKRVKNHFLFIFPVIFGSQLAKLLESDF